MRHFVSTVVALLAVISGSSAFAQTAVTDPVGFTTTTVATGKIGALSLAFNKPPDFAGPVDASTGVTANSVKTTGAAWGVNAFAPFFSNPHVVRFLSGASIGRQFQIASHTVDTLTLTTNGVDLTTVVAGSDRYEIIGLETLASLFGPTGALGTGLLTNADPTLADNVLTRGSTGYLTYYNDGTQWLRQGGSGSQNNTAIQLEQGLLLVRRGGTTYSFTALGVVPTTNLKTDLPANKITILGNRFPVATSLTGATPPALNLQNLPGWNANIDSTLADNVLTRGSFGWLTYYYDGSQWLRQGGSGVQNPNIAAGASVVIVRRAGSNITLDQPLPYTLP